MHNVPAKFDGVHGNPLAWVALMVGLLGGIMVHTFLTPAPRHEMPLAIAGGPFRPRPRPPEPTPEPTDPGDRILRGKVRAWFAEMLEERQDAIADHVGRRLQEELAETDPDKPQGGALVMALVKFIVSVVKANAATIIGGMVAGAIMALLLQYWPWAAGLVTFQTLLAYFAGRWGGSRK